ncbi:MAG: ribosome-associated translation inhibitor RaiA [Spirochaetaceae bacterium]|nr:ribosome-associated translation inhibitor RaiA [Spirochaetaceae bacterium]
MNFEIKGVHYKISEATREQLEKKVARFDRLAESIRDFNVIISKEHTGYTVEIVVNFNWGGEATRINDSDEQLWPLIDIVFDRVDAKISKEKEKNERKA